MSTPTISPPVETSNSDSIKSGISNVSATSSVTRAVRSDGFVDFYELLGVPGNASEEMIRERLGDLYNEAQANREHRQLVKRREAEIMLDLLPHCRLVLLHDGNRTSYDAYAAAARAQSAPTNFETFMNLLLQNAEADSERSGLLGFRDEPVVIGRATRATNTRIVQSPAQIAAPRKGSWWAVSGAFAFIFVLLDLPLQQQPAVTIVSALLGGALTWIATSRPVTASRQSVSQGIAE